MRRAIRIEETGEELDFSLFMTPNFSKILLEITQLSDGTCRLLASQQFVDDFSKITALKLSNKILTLEGVEKSLQVSKVSAIDNPTRTIEVSKDNKNNIKMIFSKSLFPMFKDSLSLTMIREG